MAGCRFSITALTTLLCLCLTPVAAGTLKQLPPKLQAIASADGAYLDLIQVVACPGDPEGDLKTFGKFRDGGNWEGGLWCGQEGKAGYWVWVYPNWYVWGREKADAASHPPDFVAASDTLMPERWYKNGNNWLALVCAQKACALEPASLEVKNRSWETTYQGLLKGQNLTFRLDNSHARAKVIAYFPTERAPAWLKPGPIPLYSQGSAPEQVGKPQDTIRLDQMARQVNLPSGGEALLQPTTNEHKRPGLSFTQPLLLREGDHRQWLDLGFGECAGIGNDWLLWAGELDGDGKPDYLVDLMDEQPVALLLSGAARPGDLVGVAATNDSGIYYGGDCS